MNNPGAVDQVRRGEIRSVEGLNNKARVISHKVYGFRTAEGYIRNLYHCKAE